MKTVWFLIDTAFFQNSAFNLFIFIIFKKAEKIVDITLIDIRKLNFLRYVSIHVIKRLYLTLMPEGLLNEASSDSSRDFILSSSGPNGRPPSAPVRLTFTIS